MASFYEHDKTQKISCPPNKRTLSTHGVNLLLTSAATYLTHVFRGMPEFLNTGVLLSAVPEVVPVTQDI